jgi:hypothetical protein
MKGFGMVLRQVSSHNLLVFLFGFLLTNAVPAQTGPGPARQISLGERVACQTAIEQVYFGHRESSGAKLSFDQAVPREVVQRKAAHGGLQFNSNGSFTYKPIVGFVGADTFTYQANDGLANSNIATVQLTVQ